MQQNTRKQLSAFLTTTMFTCMASVSIVYAAELANDSFEEILVTAERRESSLQETPISITALTEKSLNQYGVQDIFDLQLMTPGLIVSQTFQGNIYIRGIGTDLQGVGADASVALHLDGIYVTRPNAAVQDFYDVERIEVLRGPQGTLYGRNATGGVINVISKQPINEFSASGDILYGNYNKLRFRGAISGPLIKDKLLARFAFMSSNRDGYVDNLATGTDLLDEDVMSARGMLKFIGSDNFDALLTIDGTRNRSRSLALAVIDPQNNLGVLFGGNSNAPGDYFNIYNDMEAPMKRDQYGVSLKMNWRLEGVTVTSISAYRRSSTRRALDSEATDFPFVGEEGSWEKSKAFTQEIQLSSNNESPLQWVLGAFYLHEKAKADFLVLFPFIGADITIPAENTVNALAGFGQATYAVTDALRITAGLRYSYEKKDESNANTFNDVVTVTGGGKDSWKAWTPKFVVDYKMAEDVMAYLSATRGFKSGGFNSVGFQPSFDPEYIWSYEAGLKTAFLDNKVQANLSGFYYDYSDLQVTVIDGVSTAVDNAAKARVYGAELEMVLRPVKGLTIEGSLALLDAKFKELTTEDPVLPGVLQDFSGNRLPRSPKTTASLAVQYTWPVANYGSLSARGEYQYNGQMYFSQYNAPYEQQDEFSVVNAKLTFTSEDERWNISVFGKNLSDKTYLVSAFRLAIIGGGSVGTVAPPRTYGVSFGFNF